MVDGAAFENSTRSIFPCATCDLALSCNKMAVFLLTITGHITANFLCISSIWVQYFFAVTTSPDGKNS